MTYEVFSHVLSRAFACRSFLFKADSWRNAAVMCAVVHDSSNNRWIYWYTVCYLERWESNVTHGCTHKCMCMFLVYYSGINMIEMWVLTSCHNSNPFPCPGFLGLGEQRWMVRFGWLSRTPDLEWSNRSCPDPVPMSPYSPGVGSCCSSVAFKMICGTCGMCGFLWQDFVQVSKRCAFLKQFGPTWQCSVLRGHFTNDVEKGRAKKDCQATRLSLQLAAACCSLRVDICITFERPMVTMVGVRLLKIMRSASRRATWSSAKSASNPSMHRFGSLLRFLRLLRLLRSWERFLQIHLSLQLQDRSRRNTRMRVLQRWCGCVCLFASNDADTEVMP